MFETFDHTADIGLRIRAATPKELFRDAGVGLFSLIVANFEAVRPEQQIEIALSAHEDEWDYLMFDWLNELLFTFDSRKLILTKFNVMIASSTLQAKAFGETFDPARHRLDHEVKAITYHGLKVVQEPNGWLAEVILDI